MDAEEIYRALDSAGLTPPVHYAAAPHEWRSALERIEGELDAEVWALDREIQTLDALTRSQRTKIWELQSQLEEARNATNQAKGQQL